MMDSPAAADIIAYIRGIVFDGSTRPAGVTIGVCYGMAAERFNVPRRDVVDAWLEATA